MKKIKPYTYNGYQLIAQRIGESKQSEKLDSPNAAYKAIRDNFIGLTQEAMYVFCLNTNNRIIGSTMVSLGILNTSLCHPREVFKPAILMSAASVIIAHNHPSGNTEPSEDDIKVTRQLVEAGKILGITVFDHLVVTENDYTSLLERGLL